LAVNFAGFRKYLAEHTAHDMVALFGIAHHSVFQPVFRRKLLISWQNTDATFLPDWFIAEKVG